MATPYSGGFYNDDYGGSNEGLGILVIVLVVIGLLFGLYIFIQNLIKDKDFRQSVKDKSKKEFVELTKGLENLPRDIVKQTVDDVKIQSTIEQFIFWVGWIIIIAAIVGYMIL